MKAETFLTNFGHLADAPGGVKKLREMVLQLAVMGKLVDQDPDDEPAEVLLSQMESMRRQLVQSGQVGTVIRSLDFEGDAPFPIPRKWNWARLAQFGVLIGGGTPSKQNAEYWTGTIPWVSPKDMKLWHIDGAIDHISDSAIENSSAKLIDPPALLAVVRGMILAHSFPVALTQRPVAINQDMKALRLTIPESAEYLLVACRAGRDRMLASVHRSSHGTCRVSTQDLAQFPIPLPPLAEQHRIVAKVDELMALCDELEARQQERRAVQIAWNSAALDRLTSAENETDFATAWTRVRTHFDPLYSLPENVQALRQTILQLAVMGKLVKQDPDDEPAAVLVERLQTEMAQFRANGQTRNRRPLPPIGSAEVHELPSSLWTWVRFDLVAEIVGGVTKGRKLSGRKTKSFPYLRVANVQAGFLDLRTVKEIEIPLDELPKYQLKRGDLLLTEGGDWDQLGRSAIWEDQLDCCLHQNHVFRARVPSEGVRPEWLRLFTNSPLGRAYFQAASKQTTNLASINMTQLRSCPLPLPPTAEQDRILTKVNQLMARCDELESQLTEQQAGADRLTEAMVAAILEGTAAGASD